MTAQKENTHTAKATLPNLLKWLALVVATLIVTLAFIGVVRPFLMALVMAAIMAALLDPVFRWVLSRVGDRRALASALTLLFAIATIMIPLFVVLGIAAGQAASLADSAAQAIDDLSQRSTSFTYPEWWPADYRLDSMGPEVMSKIGELTASAANFLLGSLSSIAGGTARFFLDMFVFLYALFFFVQMETPIARILLSYSGLPPNLQETLWERVVSISRATLKGTLVIGVIQGLLGSLGFWATGLGSPAFWGVVMALVSVIPGIGPTLILAGGAIVLAIEGSYVAAVGLAVWGFGVVGTVDNVLRPLLVGRDAKLPDILILVSTLGGLGLFGAAGLIVGPVVAGLFIAIWQTMRDVMESGSEPSSG